MSPHVGPIASHTVPELLCVCVWAGGVSTIMGLHFSHEHIFCFVVSDEDFSHVISSQPPVKMINQNPSDRKCWKQDFKKSQSSLCVYVYVSSLSGTHIWQAETDVLSVPVSLSLPYSFEDGSLWTRTLPSGKSGWLESSTDLPVSASQCWDCRNMQLCPAFYVGYWGFKLKSSWLQSKQSY